MRGVMVNGSEVLAARLNRGLTQDELSRLADVDAKTIRKAEQGKRVDLVPLARIAAVLKTDLRLLIVPDDATAGQQVIWRDVVLQWHHAFNACDGQALTSLYHEQAVLRLPGGPNIPFGGTFHGRSEIRKTHELVWSTVRQEPIRLDEITMQVSDEGVTLKGDKGVYTPSGELIYLPCLQFFTFADNLIMEHQVEFDTLDFATRVQPPS